MKTGDGFVQGYNAQAAVDAFSQAIVARGLTESAADVNALAPLVQEIKENNGRQAEELSADAGYCSEENLKELNRRHIDAYVATGRQKHGQASATGGRATDPGPDGRARVSADRGRQPRRAAAQAWLAAPRRMRAAPAAIDFRTARIGPRARTRC